MKQLVSFLALLAIYFVSISAHSERVIAPTEGFTAPNLDLKKGDQVISTGDLKGKYLLLTFWSTTDAPSRLRCNMYESLVNGRADIQGIAVNLDRSARLFEEVVNYDNLSVERQFHLDRDAANEAIELFGMTDGLRTFLIDPSGRVIAINPTLNDIPV